jgi:hypothetical protein
MADADLQNLLNKPKPHYNPAPSPATLVHVLTLPNNFYARTYTISSNSLRKGAYLPLEVLVEDPSYSYGSDYDPSCASQKKKDAAAIAAMEKVLNRESGCIKVFIFQPLVGSSGRSYTESFVLAAADLCRKHNVLVVAEESSSFVRCGHPLYSLSLHGFRPDAVIVGKGLERKMLLVNSSLARFQQIQALFDVGFTEPADILTLAHLAVVLDQILQLRVWERCVSQGVEIVKLLEKHQVEVRNCGLMIWQKKSELRKLPVRGCLDGRILPRLDQTAAMLAQQLDPSNLAALHSNGYRHPICADCADDLRVNDLIFQCQNCIRQYHRRCNQKCTCVAPDHRLISATVVQKAK